MTKTGNQLSITDGGVIDVKIGNRTVTDTTAPTGNTGSLTTLLGWIGNMIKSITGKSTWTLTPSINLEQVNTKFDAAAGHKHTGAAGDAPKIDNTGLATDAVQTVQIKDLNVTTVKIADKGVTTAKINDLAVGTAQLAANAVTAAKIADATITATQMAANSATDAVVGNRVADQAIATTSSSTGTLSQLLSWMAKAIKGITGTNNWYEGPRTTLANAVKLDGDVMTGTLTNSAGVNYTRPQNFKVGTDLPATYPQGVTMFYATDASWPSSQSGTVYSVKSATDMAMTQFFYPYNVDAPIRVRHALYNSNSWGAWRDIWDTAFAGADGAITSAKLADNSVTTAKIANANVTSAKLANGAATDVIVGNRTVDQAIATAFGNTGDLTTLLSFLAKQMKNVTGGTNWYDSPAATISALNTGKLDKSGGALTNFLTLHADPTQAMHPVTKQYADAIKQSLDIKDSVRVATTANIALSGTQTIDGVGVVAGDRVLVKDQTTSSANGIYVVAAGAWSRSVDADSSAKVTGGMFTFVTEGTINSDSGWVLTTNDTITLGSTNLTFSQFSGAGQVTASDGLYKSGSQLGISDFGVTADKLAGGSVVAGKLALSAVITSNIADAQVTYQKLADASVGTLKIADGNVTSAKLVDSGVTAGTYAKVTVNSKGIVTASASLIAADIPNLDWNKITSGKPTTLSGYGITDAAPSIHTHTIADVSSLQDSLTAVGGNLLSMASSGTTTYYPIAALDVSGANIVEKVVVELSIGDASQAGQLGVDTIVITNRTSFNYEYRRTGAGQRGYLGIVAIRLGSNAVYVYAVTKNGGNSYGSVRARVDSNGYTPPAGFNAPSAGGWIKVGTGTTTPASGTTMFDSTSNAPNSIIDDGAGNSTFRTITSNVATGVAPFSVASTTVTPNMNADLLDGQHGSYYAASGDVGNKASLQTTDKSNLVAAVNELFTSVSDGKATVAAAITGKGVATAATDTFAVMADNIDAITTGLPIGQTWTIRTSPADSSWQSVCYGEGKFVAVASGSSGGTSRIMCSTDGITWTLAENAPANGSWVNVTYGAGVFVAVDTSSSSGLSVLTSPDGINWTPRAVPIQSTSLNGVAYGNGQFVAVGASAIITSPDGITWTLRSSLSSSWTSVTYGEGVFVAVSAGGSGNRIVTSPDGVTWTVRTVPGDNFYMEVRYGGGIFVAVGTTGTGTRAAMSTDGITWTTSTTPGDLNWYGLDYANGTFVATATSGTGSRVMTSPDGINWTLRSTPADNNWVSVAYGNGVLVAVSSSGTGNRVMTSGSIDSVSIAEDVDMRIDRPGVNWTTRVSMAGSTTYKSIAYGNGVFVAVADSGMGAGGFARVMSSTDGINWTGRSAPIVSTWTGVCFGKGLFVAVANSGTGKIGRAHV